MGSRGKVGLFVYSSIIFFYKGDVEIIVGLKIRSFSVFCKGGDWKRKLWFEDGVLMFGIWEFFNDEFEEIYSRVGDEESKRL